jgi:peptidoglycan/xylan/chitin deacetylase (PgdA/CDA1 family)
MCKNVLFFLVNVLNRCSFHCQKEYSNTPGIVLSFDDYSPDTWEQHFDLFDKYEARVTFFVMAGSVSNFMLNAQNRGHEIGFHTINHPNLSNISREEFFEETISRISVFKEADIELTSFAYPYGENQPWMHDELLKYYKIVRGFKKFRLYTMNEMKFGFIDSASIDNIRYKSEINFRLAINNMLQSAKDYGKIITLTSHQISDDEWGITSDRLGYVLKKCQKYGLTFYRYNDLQ